MGGGNSKSISVTNDVTNRFINNLTQNINKSCSSNTENIQNIEVKNIKFDNCMKNNLSIDQTASSSLNANCINSIDVSNAFNNSLKQGVLDSISSKEKDSFLQFMNKTDVSTINTILTDVKNSQDYNEVSNCIMNSLNQQTQKLQKYEVKCTDPIVVDGHVTETEAKLDLNQMAGANAVINCTNGSKMFNNLKSEVVNEIVNKNDISNSNLLESFFGGISGLFSSLFSGPFMFLLSPLLIIMILAFSITFFKWTLSSSESNSQGLVISSQQQQQQQFGRRKQSHKRKKVFGLFGFGLGLGLDTNSSSNSSSNNFDTSFQNNTATKLKLTVAFAILGFITMSLSTFTCIGYFLNNKFSPRKVCVVNNEAIKDCNGQKTYEVGSYKYSTTINSKTNQYTDNTPQTVQGLIIGIVISYILLFIFCIVYSNVFNKTGNSTTWQHFLMFWSIYGFLYTTNIILCITFTTYVNNSGFNSQTNIVHDTNI